MNDNPQVKEPASNAEGRSAAEATQRLAQFGYNELQEKKRNPLMELLVHSWGPIPWMIEAVTVLSAAEEARYEQIARQALRSQAEKITLQSFSQMAAMRRQSLVSMAANFTM